MERPITGYGVDEESDWFAYLSCGHRQHVRHRPPFINRPWVTTRAGRDGMLDWRLDCVRCDRLEWPDGLVRQQCSEEFTEKDISTALAQSHVGSLDIWVCIVVLSGALNYRIPELGVAAQLTGNNPGIVPPRVQHEMEPCGPATFAVEHWQVPDPPPDVYD